MVSSAYPAHNLTSSDFPTFNPQAPNFNPGERAASKHKASLSAPSFPHRPVESGWLMQESASPTTEPLLQGGEIFRYFDGKYERDLDIRVRTMVARYGIPAPAKPTMIATVPRPRLSPAARTSTFAKGPTGIKREKFISAVRQRAAELSSTQQVAESDAFSALSQINGQTPNDSSLENDNIDTHALLRHAATDGNTTRRICAILYNHEETEQSNSSQHQGRVRYLPLCPYGHVAGTDDATFTVTPSRIRETHQKFNFDGLGGVSWPAQRIPVELFDLIVSYMSRDDIKSMRAVSREFEQKVSRSLFHASVVPFNTEIYDMIDEETKSNAQRPAKAPSGKGKGRTTSSDAVDTDYDSSQLHWRNAKEDKDGKVYRGHGLQVFRGFGPHIRRFGMSFEVAESQLLNPPVKRNLEHFTSYHGHYRWPPPQYTRFANLAGLERTADESSRMKAAFANLTNAEELALSIDNGLGWLNGPDRSLRSQIFAHPLPVFKRSNDAASRALEAAEEFWAALQESHQAFDSGVDLKEISLGYIPLPSERFAALDGTPFADPRMWPALDYGSLASVLHGNSIKGVLCGMPTVELTSCTTDVETGHRSDLVPAKLRKEQNEWLLETEWAQCAFLESYMLSVIDNPGNFHRISRLNIAKLSSRYIPLLARESFWDALPGVFDVVMHVKPDWRMVERDDAGFAETSRQAPSYAVNAFYHHIICERISERKSIKRLSIGWVDGGEHAEGIFARNKHLLPSPITSLEKCTSIHPCVVILSHIEDLTLYNCWLAPPTLEGLVMSHLDKSLRRLTLDSVSITAHPSFPPNGNNNGPAAAHQLAQAILTMHGHMGNAHLAAMQPQQPLQNGPVSWAQAVANGQGPVTPQQMQLMQQQLQVYQQMAQTLPGIAVGNTGVAGTALSAATGTNNHANVNQIAWAANHRLGSWPDVLNTIAPGRTLSDFLPAPANPHPTPPTASRLTKLKTLTLHSCGYVRLPGNTTFDQFRVEHDALSADPPPNPYFRARHGALKESMMESRDRFTGIIVQYMPPRELVALLLAWGITEGWADQVAAEAVEFDGLRPGGTGRISGELRAEE